MTSEATDSCKVISEYFSNYLVMDESPKEIIKEKQSTSKKPQAKSIKTRKRSNKQIKGQKDIRTLIKSKKNELLKYMKDFDLVCKQSGIDVDPEQLQLAIALSKSLEDNKSANNGGINTEKSLTCNQRRSKIRHTLQEYGFKTLKSPSTKAKKYRKPYKLLLVSDTEKKQRIADKYAQILIQNCTISKINDEILLYIETTNSCIYNLTTNVLYDYLKDDDIFYVNGLVPKSLHKKHIFKDWSKIPGRPSSPELGRTDINFKSAECSQEQLDNILSGLVVTAQDIVKSLGIIRSKENQNTPIKGTEVNHHTLLELKLGITKNKTSEDFLTNKFIDVVSYTSLQDMSPPINRSCSPDLFDDDVTIVMDSSEDKISNRTMTVKDQGDYMDLTKCVDIMNCNNSNSNQYLGLSQGKNKTKINPNDFMDLTECVTASSQRKSNNVHNSCSHLKGNENDSTSKESNKVKAKDLNQSTNLNYNIKSSNDNGEKALEDTIIMIDEEYCNINPSNNCSHTHSLTSKETVFIDLEGEQYKSSKVRNTTINESVVDLHQSPENNCVNNYDKNSFPNAIVDQDNENREYKSPESNRKSYTMDLTQPSTYNDCLSFKNVRSIITCEIHKESDRMHTTVQLSRNPEYDKMEDITDKGSEKFKYFETMDLTQSSNSEDGLQVEPCVSKKLLYDTITLNHIESNSNDCVNNNVERDENILDYVDLHNGSPEQVKHCNNKLIHNQEIDHYAETITKMNFDKESDREFDNLLQNACNRKLSNNVLEHILKCSIETEKLDSENKDSSDIQIQNSNIIKDENSDLDLTQQSDTSEETFCIPKIIEVPDELGKRNNISIDYDDVCEKANNIRECEITSSIDIDKFTESENISNEGGVPSSSQHSEIFELSDNEFNYSVNQHLQDDDSFTLKQAKFDIGGISTIDDFLSQNTLSRRSKLRCSCTSNGEPNVNSNEVENCFPVDTLRNNKNLIGNNNVNRESKSCEDIKFVKISTPLKYRSDDNILIAKTPKHDDYTIKTDHVTPMPNYENMTSPERNEELDKFGVRPLKRKRAIQILTHIYNQTHPLMEVISENQECSSPFKIRRIDSVASISRRVITSEINSIVMASSTESTNPVLEIIEPDLSQKAKSRKESSKNSQKSPDKKHVSPKRFSSNKENDLYEETTLIPDIRNIECCPEDWVFQKREKAKVQSCRVPLHIAFHNYVSSRRALREAILKYEPINIDDIHKGLVAVGYRYNPKDLLKFMDRKCITVKTAENTRKNKNT